MDDVDVDDDNLVDVWSNKDHYMDNEFNQENKQRNDVALVE